MAAVEITGSPEIPADELLKRMKLRPGRWFSTPFRADLLDADVRALQAYLRAQGFAEAAVGPPRLDVERRPAGGAHRHPRRRGPAPPGGRDPRRGGVARLSGRDPGRAAALARRRLGCEPRRRRRCAPSTGSTSGTAPSEPRSPWTRAREGGVGQRDLPDRGGSADPDRPRAGAGRAPHEGERDPGAPAVRPGDLLDPDRLLQGGSQLTDLGVFERVDVEPLAAPGHAVRRRRGDGARAQALALRLRRRLRAPTRARAASWRSATTISSAPGGACACARRSTWGARPAPSGRAPTSSTASPGPSGPRGTARPASSGSTGRPSATTSSGRASTSPWPATSGRSRCAGSGAASGTASTTFAASTSIPTWPTRPSCRGATGWPAWRAP